MAAERQGSRWLYAAPEEDELKEWFRAQKLHDGMEHDPYYGGIVLIGAKEKYNQTVLRPNSQETYVRENERMVFVPYVKVDTRIAYFWDLIRKLNGDKPLSGDYIGVIEPVKQKRIEDPSSAYFNLHLPDGFFVMPVQNSNGSFNRYFGCTQRVAIYERDAYMRDEGARPLIQGTGTKQTAQGKTWADDNALMKAETSAVGRAMGMAGILVVGTGVASAEDMQELASGPSGENAAREPSLPPVQGPEVEAGNVPPPVAAPDGAPMTDEQERESLIERVSVLMGELRSDFPEQSQLTAEWYAETSKGAAVAELPVAALKGVVVKVERDLDAAKQAQAERA